MAKRERELILYGLVIIEERDTIFVDESLSQIKNDEKLVRDLYNCVGRGGGGC